MKTALIIPGRINLSPSLSLYQEIFLKDASGNLNYSAGIRKPKVSGFSFGMPACLFSGFSLGRRSG